MHFVRLFVLCFILFSCEKKSDNPAPANGTPAQADTATTLPGRTWVLSGQTATSASGTVNEYNTLLGCDRDNTYSFTASPSSATSGTYQYREGATSCDGGANALIHNGTYRLSTSKDSVIMVQAGFSVSTPFKIQSITTQQLKLQFTGMAGGQQTTYLYTYSAN